VSQLDTYVSVVAPLSNDADIVEAFVDDCVAMLRDHFTHFEIILVDDGSTDETPAAVDRAIAAHPPCRLIRLSRQFGTEVAIAAGLENAIGDFVAVLLPASDPTSLVPEMVERCRGGAGVVTGIRSSREGEPWYLKLGAAVFYRLADRLLGVAIPPNSTHFKVLSRQVVNAVIRIPDQARFLRTLTTHVGYRDAYLPYEPIRRRTPVRRKSLVEAVKLAVRILVANSLQPLYFIVSIGAVLIVACAGYLLYVLAIYLFLPEVAAGWTSTNAVTATMFGSLALIGTVGVLYLARLLEERSDWPLYFVLEERTAATPDLQTDRLNVVDQARTP